MQTTCVPRSGPKGALACELCADRKVGCSHVGHGVTSTPVIDVGAWTSAVREGAERIAVAMDDHTRAVERQSRALEAFMDDMRASRRGASSRGSSSREEASTVAADEPVEVEISDDEEMEAEGLDVGVDIEMGKDGEESGGDEEEEEDKEGEEGDDDDDSGEDEELEWPGPAQRTVAAEGAGAGVTVAPEEGRQVGAPRPRMKTWMDKGKDKA